LGYAMDADFYGCKDQISEMAERLPKLTVEDVNAAVRKHLASQGMKVAIVARDAAALRDLLTSGKPTPLVYDTQGTPADVLAEDKEIAAFPLRDLTVRIVPVQEMFEK
jgi:zinc protease